MKIVVIEAGRGLGKSTIVRHLRDAMTNTVAINFTGYNEDSQEGLATIVRHYSNWLTFLSYENFDSSPFTFLADRFFFSEKVYSKLYKENYNFSLNYTSLLSQLDLVARKAEVQVIHLVSSKSDIERNLSRDGKAHLFGEEKFSDDVHKTMEQQEEYERLFVNARANTNNIEFKRVDLSGLTLEESIKAVRHVVNN